MAAGDHLREEEAMQLWTQAMDQQTNRSGVTLLVARHQCFQIGIRVHARSALPQLSQEI